MKRIAIVGAGGNARELADILHDLPDFDVLGFLAENHGSYDSPTLGDFTWPAEHAVDAFAMGIGDPLAKARVGRELQSRYPQIEWPAVVHPSAYLGSGVKVGRGAIVCVHAVVTVNVDIGDFSQLNFGCTVGHEAVIGEGCLVNPGANISGGVQLGRSVLVGTGSQILQYLKVGDRARIGAGAVVTADVQPGATVVGVPAGPMSLRKTLDGSN
jgi:sugar O-acyltransferase (sialic acid O-acetyltransferase NeuD family)